MDYCHWENNPLIWRAFIEKSGTLFVGWKTRGSNLTWLAMPFPASICRFSIAWNPFKIAGPVILKALRQHCESLGVKLLLNCPAKKLSIDKGGQVNGVLADIDGKDVRIDAKSVIIARRRLYRK